MAGVGVVPTPPVVAVGGVEVYPAPPAVVVAAVTDFIVVAGISSCCFVYLIKCHHYNGIHFTIYFFGSGIPHFLAPLKY